MTPEIRELMAELNARTPNGIMSIKDIQAFMGCSRPKATALMRRLGKKAAGTWILPKYQFAKYVLGGRE
jgi:hypothetical protein